MAFNTKKINRFADKIPEVSYENFPRIIELYFHKHKNR